jgi:hypothetical protein
VTRPYKTFLSRLLERGAHTNEKKIPALLHLLELRYVRRGAHNLPRVSGTLIVSKPRVRRESLWSYVQLHRYERQ